MLRSGGLTRFAAKFFAVPLALRRTMTFGPLEPSGPSRTLLAVLAGYAHGGLAIVGETTKLGDEIGDSGAIFVSQLSAAFK